MAVISGPLVGVCWEAPDKDIADLANVANIFRVRYPGGIPGGYTTWRDRPINPLQNLQQGQVYIVESIAGTTFPYEMDVADAGGGGGGGSTAPDVTIEWVPQDGGAGWHYGHFEITNNSTTQTLTDWELQFDLNAPIQFARNCVLETLSSNRYSIKAHPDIDWTQDFAPGRQMTGLGLQILAPVQRTPGNFSFTAAEFTGSTGGGTPDPDPGNQPQNPTGDLSGFRFVWLVGWTNNESAAASTQWSGDLEIFNESGQTVEAGWQFKFRLPGRTIQNYWNFDITPDPDVSDGWIATANKDYTVTWEPGEGVAFGFTATGGPPVRPIDYVLISNTLNGSAGGDGGGSTGGGGQSPTLPTGVIAEGAEHVVLHVGGNVAGDNGVPSAVTSLIELNSRRLSATDSAISNGKAAFFHSSNLDEANDSTNAGHMAQVAAYAEKLGIPAYGYQANAAGAVAALTAILNSGDDVVVIELGPFEAIYRALTGVSSGNLARITIATQDDGNNDRNVSGNARTLSDVQTDFPDVVIAEIPQQTAFGSGWGWLDVSNNTLLQEARVLMELASSENAASGFGVTYYATTGSTTGTPAGPEAEWVTAPPLLPAQAGDNSSGGGSGSGDEPTQVYQASSGLVVIDTTTAQMRGGWAVTEFAGEDAVRFSGPYKPELPPTPGQYLDFHFRPDTTGTWYLSMLIGRDKSVMDPVRADQSNQGDDVWVEVVDTSDGSVIRSFIEFYEELVGNSTSFQWGTTFNDGGAVDATVALTAGRTYRLRMSGRSDGCVVQEIALQAGSFYTTGGTGGGNGPAPTPSPVTSGVLGVHPNNRYFQITAPDGATAPYYPIVDTCWQMFMEMSISDAQYYFRTRRSQGFNGVSGVFLAELNGLTNPNRNGDLPLQGRDPNRPIQAYFDHCLALIREAAKENITVWVLLTWGRYVNNDSIFNSSNAYSYGYYCGQLLANEDNLVIVAGGDRNADTSARRTIWNQMMTGFEAGVDSVRGTSGGRFIKTYHPSFGNPASWFGGQGWFDFNGTQTGHGNLENGNDPAAWNKLRPLYDGNDGPVVNVEPCYRDIGRQFWTYGTSRGRYSVGAVRRTAYWSAIGATCGGIYYGHNSIWQMWQSGLSTDYATTDANGRQGWRDAVTDASAPQMGYLRRLYESRPFWQLSYNDGLITNGVGGGHNRRVAALGGSFAFVYLPFGGSVSINTSLVSGSQIRAWWFDPKNSSAEEIGTYSPSSSRSFTWRNSGEHQDAVLVLDDASYGYPQPGSSLSGNTGGTGGAPVTNPNPDPGGAGYNPQPSTASYDYAKALQLGFLFYEANRSGNLDEATKRIDWRGDSSLTDGSDVGRDMTGGYHDAGDHVKSGLPANVTLARLCLAIYGYRSNLEKVGLLSEMLAAIQWGTDLILKSSVYDNQGEILEYYAQIGSFALDHGRWGSPETMTMARPSYKVTRSRPGTDAAGSAAAALAGASFVWRGVDEPYAEQCLTEAKKLFRFADQYRGPYSSVITDGAGPYGSDSGVGEWRTQIPYAAAWLAIAEQVVGRTGAEYLSKATANYRVPSGWFPSYRNSEYETAVLLTQLTSNTQYRSNFENWANGWVNGSTPTMTSGGLAFRHDFGSLPGAANASWVIQLYADLVRDPGGYKTFAKSQADYILGDNPLSLSYIPRPGVSYPQRIHHRAASGNQGLGGGGANEHVLWGALVAGPDAPDDQFTDVRSEYDNTEPSLEFQSGWMGLLAGLIGGYDGVPYSSAELNALSGISNA